MIGAANSGVRDGFTPENLAGGAATGAAGGALGAAAGKLISSVGGKIAALANPPPQIPSAANVAAAKAAAYQAADNAGVMYSPSMSSNLAGAIRAHIGDFGYDPALQPGGAGVLSTLDKMDGQNVTLKGVDTLRKVVNRMAGKGSTDSGQELAGGIRDIIDDRLANPQPGDVLGGDHPAGVAALQEGRRLAQIGFKADDFDTAVDKAQDQAASAGLGGNERNKLAQAMVRMKFGPNNWTPDEQAAIQGAITPKPGEQILRTIGKADPTAHGGVGMIEAPIAGLVGLEGGVPGMAAAAGTIASAAAARRISDAMMRNSVNRARNTILNGGVNPYSVAPNVAQRLIGAAKLPMIRAGQGWALSTPPTAAQQPTQ